MKRRDAIVKRKETSWSYEELISNKQLDSNSCGIFVMMVSYSFCMYIYLIKVPTIQSDNSWAISW